MELTFKSVQIEFFRADSDVSFVIFLPFALLPLYYFYDIEIFKFIMIGAIQFDPTCSVAELNYTLLFKILKNLPQTYTEIQSLRKEKNVTCYKFDWITNIYTYEVIIRYN